jgi:uncharacterized membrane protein YbhN (UPF0104 family)
MGREDILVLRRNASGRYGAPGVPLPPDPSRPSLSLFRRARRVAARVAAPVVGVLALGLVVAVVPLRDRCEAPTAQNSVVAKGPVERRDDGSCVLHVKPADMSLDPSTCAQLRCEPGLLSVLSHARLGLLALLAVITFAGTLLGTLRWYAVLALSGFRRSFGWTWRTVLAAQAGALLLPGGIGGDAVRFGLVVGAREQEGVAATTLAATVLLDRSLGLVSLATLSGALAAIFGGGDVETHRLLAILFALPVLFVAGLTLVRSRTFAGLAVFRTRFGAKLVPVLEYLRQPGAPVALARGLLASFCFTGLQLAVLRAIILALGAPVTSERWAYLGSAMGLLVAGLPGLPGGWGTADATYVFFLARAGLPPQINRIFYYGVAIVGACLLLASRAARKGP